MRREPLRVLVVDDHEVVREGLRAIVDREGDLEVVAEGADGADAERLYRELRPDVVVMDIRMPEVDGIEAIRKILQHDSHARILVLTTYDGDEDVYRAISAGAQGYILKDSSRLDLIDAIRRAGQGLSPVPPRIAAHLARRLRRGELTDREHCVLELVVGGRSNKEIGAELGIEIGTVKSHVTRILDKLGVGSRTEAATLALREGLVRPWKNE